jgi:hypothetical protein
VIALWTIGAVAAGFVLGRWVPEPRPEQPGWTVTLAAKHDRTARLEDVLEAARARALWIEPHHHGFTVMEQLAKTRRTLALHAPDPQHVTVASLQLSRTTSLVLPFDLALALVVVFGTITLVLDGEVYEVDGTRDLHALTMELSSRFTARARTLFASRASRDERR